MTRGARSPGGDGPADPSELAALRFLSADARTLVLESFVRERYGFGDAVVTEGAKADAFFVLASGKARVVKTGLDGGDVSLDVLKSGDSFGEMGLLDPDARRFATVRALGDVEVLRLDRPVFDALLKVDPSIRRSFELHVKLRKLNSFFRLYTPFAKLPPKALASLLQRFEPVGAAKGEIVVRQGEPPGPLFVVEEGRLRAFAEVGGRRKYLAYLRKGDVFGEASVFTGRPRAASVEAVTPCKLIRLDPAAFQRIVAENPRFAGEVEERVAQYSYREVARVPLDFAEELLPAEALVESVGADQVDREETDAEGAEDPFAAEGGLFARSRRRIRRFPLVRQIDENDCGAACLAMVCRHFGRAVSLARIRQLLFTSTEGTSLKALCRGAEELGLAARSVKVSARNLPAMPLPAIVHWEGDHWVVVWDVDADRVRIADPGVGQRRITRQELASKWTGYAALFDYTDAFEKAPVGQPSVAWLVPFLRPWGGLIAKAAGLALAVSALQMAFPVFTQLVVDRVVVDRDPGLLRLLVVAMLGVLLFSTGAMVLQRYLLSFAAVRLDAATLDMLTRRLLSLPTSYFANRRTGDIQRRLQGLRQVRELVVQEGVTALTSLAQLGTALTLMFVYSPALALVFLATAPLYALFMRFSAVRLRPTFESLEEAYGSYASHQIDAIKGAETVKALGAESALRQAMLGRFHGLARKQFRADFTILTYEGALQAVSFLSVTLFLWAGAVQVLDGRLTIGALVAFSALVGMANAPITALLGLWDRTQLGRVLLDRLNDVFEQEPEQGSDRSRLRTVRTLQGRIRFQNVSFQYGGPESPLILEDVTFEAAPNQRLAIVGRSGSGKTTLVKILAGLLEPTRGTVLFDGVDLRTLDYRSLRRRIGFVLQESYLFDETIARNIAFGDDEPDLDRVLWAARVANVHEFVERLPLGYETRVGESGLALSGGQRQRIAIARAVYGKPPVLVFDEATSSLDTDSERAVKENLDALLEDRTSFVIAHRLSTIRDADTILVLEKGRLVEQGDHDALMARRGLYYYLCSQQLAL